jgi:hypothetical protein
MLIGMAVVFGSLWLWLAWKTWQDPQELLGVFVGITVGLLVLLTFGLLSVPIYRRKTALPLEKDLEEGKKVRVIGRINAIEHTGKYTDKMILQPQDGSKAKEFFIRWGVTEVSYQAFHLKKDIEIEYTLHTKTLLRVALLEPITNTEQKEYNKNERVTIAVVFVFVGMIMLGIGWLVNLLPLFTVLYCVTVALMVVVFWWIRQKKKPYSALVTVVINLVAPFVFLFLSKTLFEEWFWKLEDWSGWNIYTVLACSYGALAVFMNYLLWNYRKKS